MASQIQVVAVVVVVVVVVVTAAVLLSAFSAPVCGIITYAPAMKPGNCELLSLFFAT